MHAFVRFFLAGRVQFVAWFEPEHRIVGLLAGFFEKRFARMDWSILTPHEYAPRDDDALGDLWRTYYRSIFNPARLKVRAMQAEMPKKYWKNLPEVLLIAELISGSSGRVEKMLQTGERPAKPAPKHAYPIPSES